MEEDQNQKPVTPTPTELAQEANEDVQDATARGSSSAPPTSSSTATDHTLIINTSNVKSHHPSPATTPEPSSISTTTTSTSLFTSWYSSSSSSAELDSKSYRNYVQNIDKCLKQFEYSTEWPDLIAALTKLNKVISTYNLTISMQPVSVQPTPPPPLPRTHLITKRLSQCLHPNLPSGVHLKTLETFELIFQGFKFYDYVNLETELFSFVSGLLPLWSYAAISVKPKLLSLYENHLVELGERLRPALDGVMLSLFCGLVDDGVEQDIKIRTTNLLSTLQKHHSSSYKTTLDTLIESHPSIHLPLITHIIQTNYLPPPTTLLHLVTSPNTLVQRNALELLNKSYHMEELPQQVQIQITRSAIQTLLKRDPSITRRVFTFIEQRQELLVLAIESLINDCEDGQAFTRILSTILDNSNVDILDRILAPVVKYLMKCEYTTSLSFLSTLNSKYVGEFFINYLFDYDTLEELESRVIVFNYVVKLRLFEIDYDVLFSKLMNLEDSHVRVILQMVRLHYTSHHDKFIEFANHYLSSYFDLNQFELLQQHENTLQFNVSSRNECTGTTAVVLEKQFFSFSLDFVLELLQKSTPDDTSYKYVVIAACTKSDYLRTCLNTYIRFQTHVQHLIAHTRALHLIFQHCYNLDKQLLNKLNYPEKYLLSEMQNDAQIRNVIDLDLSSSPLVVLKLVDPISMGTPYRRFICEQFISSNSNLIMSSVLKYLEFSVDKVVVKAKSMNDLSNEGNDDTPGEFKHAASVYGVEEEDHESCAYDSARVNTLVDKLEFVVHVNKEFLVNVDLVVLLSKLVLLATINNSQEPDPQVTLNIQTKSLRLIEKVVNLHGESTHSFVYDSILNYLSNVQVTEYSLLWELSAVRVLQQFFHMDIENYTLALVVQKRLNARANDNKLNELCERVHLRWLHAIGQNLRHLRHHFNALVLITYTTVSKNLLDHYWSAEYCKNSVKFIDLLLHHVLVPNSISSSNSVQSSGFLSSLFGNSSIKESTIDEHEALRIALLGKLDLLLKIACRTRIPGLLELLKHLYETQESSVLQAVNKCVDLNNLEHVLKDLKVPANKLSSLDSIVDNSNFLCKYLKHERSLDVQSVVSLCKHMNSCSGSLTLVTEYLKASSSKANKEVQDLVVRAIELGVEKREFGVLELFVPGIFDLVWGDVDGDSCGNGSGASNANARDQKTIVNVVHGVVVAVLVAVKAGSITTTTTIATSISGAENSTSNQLLSALRVLEQVSHHTYLRKAWKKEVFELITNEPTFFYFTPECLSSWKVIVDNLFTQDRSTFSELITRLTQTTQMSTSALNIFSSKESEIYETRASLLKRLAFVLHSSERDQYAKYITNIQEKIAEALKIGVGGSAVNMVVPAVNQSVFLCFRIMVNKFNCNVLVSLWPIIVHEVVTVLNSLQQLLDDTQTTQQQNQDPLLLLPQLQMYLQTLKLLNFLFTLPSDSQVPHFQLYKWAFTQPHHDESNNNNNAFIPYLQKLRASAISLYPSIVFDTPPLKVRHVGGLEELCSAFGCLDQRVNEAEWEVIDFCDGGGGGCGGGGGGSSSSISNNCIWAECDSSDL